ncbi:MAG: hypothetical protein J2P17_04490 [Mycobacterium sp.]|nr:hypothetical protein [Mycobacterium sp.]
MTVVDRIFHRIIGMPQASASAAEETPHVPKYRKYRAGRKCVIATTAALVAAATLSACGGGSSNNSSSGNGGGAGGGGGAKATASSGNKATINVAHSKLGQILVDSQGRTVYLFEKDTGPKSTCSGECATVWPPVRVSGSLTAGTGVEAAKLTTISRSDGKPQAVYNGHPLYLFEGDSNAGDTTGEGNTTFGAAWFVLSPAGNKID